MKWNVTEGKARRILTSSRTWYTEAMQSKYLPLKCMHESECVHIPCYTKFSIILKSVFFSPYNLTVNALMSCRYSLSAGWGCAERFIGTLKFLLSISLTWPMLSVHMSAMRTIANWFPFFFPLKLFRCLVMSLCHSRVFPPIAVWLEMNNVACEWKSCISFRF